MRRCLRSLLTATVLLTGCTAATPGPAEQRVRLPDGRMMVFACAGAGSPTVILDAGWGADHSVWAPVMPEIARTTRVCAYDRAGSGQSDPGPLPRDGKAVARDLGRGLHAAGIEGPYILVGHSIGALFARHFALRRPRAVVGMVLVDGTVTYQQKRFEAVYGPGAGALTGIIQGARDCLAKVQAQPKGPPLPENCNLSPPAVARWEDRISELETLFSTTSAQLETGRENYGAMPLITLTAANTYPEGAARLWYDLHREVAARSRRGDARFIPNSSHNMMGDQPAAVIQAVNDVVATARAR